MKQTAVEWLYDNLLFAPISRQDVKYNERKFEQAKEMEKEQKGYSEEDMEEMYNYGYNNYLPYSEAIEQFKK